LHQQHCVGKKYLSDHLLIMYINWNTTCLVLWWVNLSTVVQKSQKDVFFAVKSSSVK